MLRKLRIIIATLFFTGITLLFVGIGQDWWGWMAKIQFYPSVLRLIGGFTLGNIAVLSALVLLTLIFGRIYCSVICPLGIFQDSVIRLRNRIKKKKFKYTPARQVRNAVLGVSIALALFGAQAIIAAIAPYSTYGRMVRSIVSLADGSMTLPLVIAGLAALVLITLCAALWGRGWCNTVCPVGTLLGHIGRFSWFKIHIDTGKCRNCGGCGRDCKAYCIDTANHSIDHSRCIDCFDCIESCKFGAISYTHVRADKTQARESGKVDEGRRRFLGTAALIAGTATVGRAQDMKLDGGLAKVIEKSEPERSERLVPFGAGSVKAFYDHCTACQLCISACPNDVLRPSTDAGHLLQPRMGFDKGWCRPECKACADACPAGAIRPLEKEQKLGMKIGTAKVNVETCLAATGQENCRNCERHCPVGAIKMIIPEGQNLRRPVVMEDVCIGCGACEYLCPVRPVSAITVDGIAVHHNK